MQINKPAEEKPKNENAEVVWLTAAARGKLGNMGILNKEQGITNIE
jgi:hypothetical protein